jgi:hypothetical protein
MIGRPSEAGLRRGETATWWPSPRTAPQWPRMRLVSRKSIAKRNLRGFATIELPIGLKLVEGAVFVGTSGARASMPAKPQLDREGRLRIDGDGKPSCSPVVASRGRDLNNRCSAAVVAMVRAAHPEAFSGDFAS